MRAEERIKKYGLKEYIKTCLHKQPTPELIAKYKKKYGDKIPIEKPVRYQQTVWDAVFEDEISGEQVELKGLWSNAHKLPDNERDIEEIERKGQKELGGSNWHIIKVRYRGKRYIYREEKPKEKPKEKPREKPKKIIPREQIKEVIEGAKLAGMSPEEIGRMLKAMLK